MDFRKYDESNRNTCFIKGKKSKISNYSRVDIALSLIQNIRNRSYHWENLMKTTQRNGTTFPRLTSQCGGTHIGVAPQNIDIFLTDLISRINKDLLKYCEIEIK